MNRNFELFYLSGFFLFSPFSIYYSVIFAGSYFMFGNYSFYEQIRRLVVRMDILPHIESISVMRIGFNGVLYNRIYKIAALEKVDRE